MTKGGDHVKPSGRKVTERDEEPDDTVKLSGLVLSIKVLNLSKNNITDTGALVMSEFISNAPHIEGLQINWNKIRAKGSIALAKVIKKSHTILNLDVSFNSFAHGALRKACVKDSEE